MATTTDPRIAAMTVRERAALLVGFAAAVEAIRRKLPIPDLNELLKHGRTATEILEGGVFNPLAAFDFQSFMEKHFRA